MSTISMRASVLLWAQRVLSRKGSAPHVLLEIHESATQQEVQQAFHKIARTAHPDLFRHGLDASELELITSAYAVVAGAYQQMRSSTAQTQRLPMQEPLAVEPLSCPETPAPPTPRTASATPSSGVRTIQPPPANVPPTRSGPAPGASAAQSMSPKALLYYRKAELCLKRGDLKGAILQLKLACATDPTSGFLRTALAEVETEVRSKP